MKNNRRIQAVILADAINKMGGVPIRLYAKSLSKQWADGKITSEQMREALSNSHKQLANRNK